MIDSNFDLPGWGTAVDPRTGRQYYINLVEKTTTWEDPRKFKSIHIPMQNLHGSPKKIQIYPTQQNYPVQAFQNSSTHTMSQVSASPVPSTRTSHHSHTVEMSSLSRSSPHTPRIGSSLAKSQMQETSFSSPSPMETEATVARVNQMFPTANENHIRMLLKKYHNREAVVISALQVEKNPLATPGPFTPPVQRHQSFHSTAMALSAFTPPSSSLLSRKSVHHMHGDHLTIASSCHGSPMRPQSSSSFYTQATTMNLFDSPRFGESMLIRNSPKPHSSPKMKLRYLKSMHPKAEETIILDVLAMTENNIQKASEKLLEMGYEKKEMTPAPRLSHRKKELPKQELLIEATPPPKPKTADEKKKLKAKLIGQFKSIPEKIITMALESVDFSEERALKILEIVVQEDKDQEKKKKAAGEKKEAASLKNSRSIDLDSAAAIENDETMIINSDHSIITTPVETPMTEDDVVDDSEPSTSSGAKKMSLLQIESDETSTSDASEVAIVSDKGKRHRQKARSESARSEKAIAKITKKHDNKENKIVKKVMFEDSNIEETQESSSPMKTTAAIGADPNMSKGPRDEILLTDYVAWNGANPEILMSNKIKARGPNSSLRVDRSSYLARGHNSELCKGPKIGLSKGSIYSQMTRPNVACN